MICMGDEIENMSMMAHDKTNGQWELRGLIKHNELGDMKHLVLMKKKAY
jgi:hypothetical protein